MTKAILSTTLLLFSIFSHAQDGLISDPFEKLYQEDKVIIQPKLSTDGTRMVYLKRDEVSTELYITSNVGGLWTEPELLSTTAEYQGKKGELSYPSINFNNNVIYYSAKYDSIDTNFNLYYITRALDGTWSTPTPMSAQINSPLDEFAPSLSSNGKLIFFTRPSQDEDRPEDFCQEIYYSKKDKDGKWQVPKPVPAPLNNGCELAPFLASDNKNLYFSSYRDIEDEEGKTISKKVFNIFRAEVRENYFVHPEPILELVNDDEHQVSASIANGDNQILYGEGDIFHRNDKRRYSVLKQTFLEQKDLPELFVKVTGKLTDLEGDGLDGIIRVSDPTNFEIYQDFETVESDGSYFFYLPPASSFTMEFIKEEYSRKIDNISTAGVGLITKNARLFRDIKVNFNVFDEEMYHPVNASIQVFQDNNLVTEVVTDSLGKTVEPVNLPIGAEYQVITAGENYFDDTLTIDLQTVIVFQDFSIDLEINRKKKSVALNFTADEGGSVSVDLVVHNLTRNEVIRTSVKDGEVNLELREGEVYEISTSAKGYSYFTTKFDLSEEDDEKTDSLITRAVDIKLEKVSEKEAIKLDNITFELNSFELTAASYEELEKLAAFLEENEDYRVEIAAHTDDIGSAEYNLKLSQKRAQAVVDFLNEKNIPLSRLDPRGYGESDPLVANNSPENRAANRRVEFKILNMEALTSAE